MKDTERFIQTITAQYFRKVSGRVTLPDVSRLQSTTRAQQTQHGFAVASDIESSQTSLEIQAEASPVHNGEGVK